MVQVGYTTRCRSLWDKHNLGPAALGSVYPVETSTSLYNLYFHHQHRAGPNHLQIASGGPVEAKPPHSSKVVYAPVV